MIYFVVLFFLVTASLWYKLKKYKENSRSIKMVRNDLSETEHLQDTDSRWVIETIAESHPMQPQTLRNEQLSSCATSPIATSAPQREKNIKMVCNDLSQNSKAQSQVTEKSQETDSRSVIGTVAENITDAVTEGVHTEIQPLRNEHFSPVVQQLNNMNPAHSQITEKSKKVKGSRWVIGSVITSVSDTVTESVHTEIPKPLTATVNSLLQSRKGIESQKKSSPRPVVNVAEIIKRNTKKKSPRAKSVKRKVQRTRK